MTNYKNYTITVKDILHNLSILANAYEDISSGKSCGTVVNAADAAANTKAAIYLISQMSVESNWPSPPQANLFEDPCFSVRYLKQIASAMREKSIDGASYIEDIADDLERLYDDYCRVFKQRDRAVSFLKENYNFDEESVLKIINK